MFIGVEVRGNTMAYREILGGTYDLRWSKNSRCYQGSMVLNGNKIQNLTNFCKMMGLALAVDGVSVLSEELEDDDLEVNVEVEYDDSQLGKIGEKVVPTEKKLLPFKQVVMTRNTEPDFSVAEYFEGTRFPEARLEQQQVIPEIMNLVEQGYKNIVIECPTGSGKSAMAMMIPKIFGGNGPSAYLATHLKGLQEQYMREMPFMRSVMGKSNYDCRLDVEAGTINEKIAKEALDRSKIGGFKWNTQGCTANMAPCSLIKGFKCDYRTPKNAEGQYNWGVDPNLLCDYFEALANAQNSGYFISNMSYLMAMNRVGSMLPKRDFLIIDEAHQLTEAMTGFFSLDFSIKVIERLLQLPSHQEMLKASEADRHTLQQQRSKVLGSWHPNNNFGYGFPQIPSVRSDSTDEFRKKASAVWAAYFDALLRRVNRKIKRKDYSADELKYVYNTVARLEAVNQMLKTDWKNCLWQANDDTSPEWISFKPLNIGSYSEELMLNLGRVRIFLSGTIGDIEIYRDELGLPESNTAFIKVDYSSFPLSNRPIYTGKVGGKLSYTGKSDADVMKTVEAVIDIMNKYPNKKGLILPYTDSLEKLLVEAIEAVSPENHARLVQHDKNAKSRNQVFNDFDSGSSNQVLVSTYANQGYDGKSVDFCIILKTPFPAMGDVRTAIKMKENPSWYKMKTANEITQMLGRVVRSPTDVGHNYIIDPQFWFHYEKGIGNEPLRNFLPKYLVESIAVNRKVIA
tara:strand:- start:371 stop:2584 length:2214 start_codon:yes stop_codon:yes gene_type:complete